MTLVPAAGVERLAAVFGVFSPDLWNQLGSWGWVLWVVFYVIHAAALAAIAERTETSMRWMAWVPLLNLILMARVARVPVFLLLIGLIPWLGLPLYIGLWCLIAKRLAKPWWVGLGLLIPVIQFFVPMYLAGSDTPPAATA